jgi:aminoglycoside 3-N-acetyltransferase I
MIIQKPLKSNITISLLEAQNQNSINEFAQLLEIFAQEFEIEDFTQPNEEYLGQSLENKKFLVFTASIDGRIAGGLTGYILNSYYTSSLQIYIYDLAVKKAFQRQGIGKQLIEAVKEYAKENNISELFVQADVEDTHALAFYKATGGEEAEVRHFTYKL